MPALFTSTSIRPYRSMVASTSVAQLAGDVTSRCSTPSASSTSPATTAAPSAAKAWASAAPWPRAAPVTMATLPASLSIGLDRLVGEDLAELAQLLRRAAQVQLDPLGPEVVAVQRVVAVD